jgi:hypothetical protein
MTPGRDNGNQPTPSADHPLAPGWSAVSVRRASRAWDGDAGQNGARFTDLAASQSQNITGFGTGRTTVYPDRVYFYDDVIAATIPGRE